MSGALREHAELLEVIANRVLRGPGQPFATQLQKLTSRVDKYTISQHRPLLLCLLLVFLPGSLSAATLSDAMKAAAEGDKTPIEGTSSKDSDKTTYYDDDDDDDHVGGRSGAGAAMGVGLFGAAYRNVEYPWHIPVDAEYLVPFSGDIQGMTRFSIMLPAMEVDRALLGLYFSGGLVQFKDGSLADAATSGAWTFGMGVRFRYYFSDAERPVNPYVTTQLGWQYMGWDYRTPIVLGDGSTISSDALNSFDSYAGFGLAWRRERRFSLFSEVGIGGMITAGETVEEFDNDVFENFGYFGVKIGFSLKF